MNQALQNAQADLPFQFFLAKLFGDPVEVRDSGLTLRGYGYRGYLYVTEESIQDTPTEPNPDSSA
jgi:hypothetical protein